MAFKFIVVLCAFATAANAGYLAGPAVATYAAAPAPVVRYSPATAVSHSYSSIAAPAALSYAAPSYAAPIAKAVSYAPATVAVSAPAIGSSQQNVYRSFDGTVSQYSKAVDTAFSSVRKYDTRVSNNVYAPAIAKTLAYAAPAPAVYAAPAPAVVAHAAPAVVAHSAPAYVAAHAAPAYAAPAYAASAYAAPAYAAPAYVAAHAAPATAYASKAISYSPAGAVAHVTFDGLGVHYGW